MFPRCMIRATIFQMSHISSSVKLSTFMAPRMMAKYSLSPMSLPSCSCMMSQVTVLPWQQTEGQRSAKSQRSAKGSLLYTFPPPLSLLLYNQTMIELRDCMKEKLPDSLWTNILRQRERVYRLHCYLKAPQLLNQVPSSRNCYIHKCRCCHMYI